MVEGSAASRLQGERVLVTGAALADGTSDSVVRDVALLVDHGILVGLWTDGSQPEPAELHGVTVIDGVGATIVPGMVDSHAHLSMPGGADWVNRGFDSVDTLLAVGEENGELMVRAGIRWARDVGAPRRLDPATGKGRAASLMLRERWQGRQDRPYIRAAGTWLLRPGALPTGLGVEVEHAADLPAAVRQQLDEGADLVKLYLDGPDPDIAPFSADEVSAAVRAAHERGAKVAAHATGLAGNRVGAEAGVDSLEHGFQIDADIANLMVANNVTLVSTLAVVHSWRTFATTSTMPRFTDPEMRPKLDERLETASASVRTADAAGVPIAAGSDFGGGSLRANQLVWEVEAMIAAGVEPKTALAAATWRGGELLGVPHAGRLVVGQPAHFSLVHGDPLSDPAALWRVWLTR
jgi:imidazolonepropionase-like amidohydrolase